MQPLAVLILLVSGPEAPPLDLGSWGPGHQQGVHSSTMNPEGPTLGLVAAGALLPLTAGSVGKCSPRLAEEEMGHGERQGPTGGCLEPRVAQLDPGQQPPTPG